jgi:hypothetical protein
MAPIKKSLAIPLPVITSHGSAPMLVKPTGPTGDLLPIRTTNYSECNYLYK